MDHDRAIDELVARQQIHDCLMRYARGVDRRDRDAIVSSYHPDALDDHGQVCTRQEFVDAVLASHPNGTHSHFIGNVLIELYGDVALVESYFIAYHYYHDDEGEHRLRMRSGRYVDRFERRNDAWRIAHRVVVDDWNRLDVVTPVPLRQTAHAHGAFPADPVYAMRQEILADRHR